jgi:hypothetical protein
MKLTPTIYSSSEEETQKQTLELFLKQYEDINNGVSHSYVIPSKLFKNLSKDDKNKLYKKINSIYPGRWNIPNSKLKEFYQIYANSDKTYCISELHIKECSPIIIDIDVEQSENKSKFSLKCIKCVISLFYQEINKFTEIDNKSCYVLKRNKPYKKTNEIYKDGLHIYFPDIVTEYSYQIQLRNNLLSQLKELLLEYDIKGNIEEIYDIAPCKSSGSIMLYNSSKFHNNKFLPKYKIVRKYMYDDDNMNKQDIEEDIWDILKILSIRNKTEINKCDDNYIENMKTKSKTELKNINIKNDEERDIENDDEIKDNDTYVYKNELIEYLNLLNNKYYDDRTEWLKIGAIIWSESRKEINKNVDKKKEIDNEWLTIFDNFSKKSTDSNNKYESFESIKKLWKSFKINSKNKATMKTIYKALIDDGKKKELFNIQNKYKQQVSIVKCINENKNKFDNKDIIDVVDVKKILNGKNMKQVFLKGNTCRNMAHDTDCKCVTVNNNGSMYMTCNICQDMYPIDGLNINNNYITAIFNVNNTINNYYGSSEDLILSDKKLPDKKIKHLLQCIDIKKRIQNWESIAELMKKKDESFEDFKEFSCDHFEQDCNCLQIWNSYNNKLITYENMFDWAIEDNIYKLYEKDCFELNDIISIVSDKVYSSIELLYMEIYKLCENYVYIINSGLSRRIALKMKYDKDTTMYKYELGQWIKFKKDYEDVVLYGIKLNSKGNTNIKLKLVDVICKLPQLNYKGIFNKPYHPFENKNDEIDEYVNTFSPMTAEYINDELYDENKISPILNHIKEVWCNNDDFLYKYVLSYFSQIIKTPWNKTNICLVIYGIQGVGKSCILEAIIKYIMGPSCGLQTNGLSDLVNKQFQEFLENKLFIVCEEPTMLNDMNFSTYVESLKNFITAGKLNVEKKFADKYVIDSYHNLIITCNHLKGIHIQDEKERRFVVLKCSDKYVGNVKYFNVLNECCNNKENMNMLFSYFYKYNDKIPLLPVPMTEGKEEAIEEKMSVYSQFLFCKENREELFMNEEYSTIELYDIFKYWYQNKMNKNTHYLPSRDKFIKEMKEYGESKRSTIKNEHGKQPTVFYFGENTKSKINLLNKRVYGTIEKPYKIENKHSFYNN